jgi:hypothetical protein
MEEVVWKYNLYSLISFITRDLKTLYDEVKAVPLHAMEELGERGV